MEVLVAKILHNVVFNVDNLVLTYFDEANELMASVSCGAISCYTADDIWQCAFVVKSSVIP